MDIRSLQLFEHLATSLHFGKTAEALHLSPSALTRVIQRLEQECGATLLRRDNRNVQLTAPGQKLLTFAQQTLVAWQALKLELDDYHQILHGELSLYCSVTASFSHLPQLLARFHHHFPGIEIHVQTGDPALSLQKVSSNEVDIAIAVRNPDFPKTLKFTSIDQIPMVMITPKSQQIQGLGDIDWASQPVVLPESGPSKMLVDTWFAAHQIQPQVYASIGGNEAIVSMVALGCGVAIVPSIVVQHSVAANRVRVWPLENCEHFDLGLCCLRSRANEPAISALMALVNRN